MKPVETNPDDRGIPLTPEGARKVVAAWVAATRPTTPTTPPAPLRRRRWSRLFRRR